jgi:hypothetical protein
MKQTPSSLVRSSVVTLFIAVILGAYFYFDADGKQYYQLITDEIVVCCLLATGVGLSILATTRGIVGSNNFEAFRLGLLITVSLTIFGVALSILISNAISIDHKATMFTDEALKKLVSDSTIFSILLGAPTIIGILCTFVSLREHLLPKALGFSEVIDGLTKFVGEHWKKRDGNVWFTFCGSYPCFGVAKRDELEREYAALQTTITSKNILCLSLPLLKQSDAGFHENVDDYIDDNMKNQRQDSINSAVAAFINMWVPAGGSKDETDTLRKNRYKAAIDEIGFNIGIINGRNLFKNVKQVPEYLFIIAYKDEKRLHPFAAYFVFPFVSPGMEQICQSFLASKWKFSPMFALEVEDRSIVETIHKIAVDLAAL